MPQDNCDTGRRIFANKRDAAAADPNGNAKRCARCKGWHATGDRPQTSVAKRKRYGKRR